MVTGQLIIPLLILLGGLGLAAFIWVQRSSKYEQSDDHAKKTLFGENNPEKSDFE
ncbi:MAG: cbb3-type cytochrome oxidase assembly protein CcoS [Alphaproteobacteria bacterium]